MSERTDIHPLTIEELDSWLGLVEMYSGKEVLLHGAAGEDAMNVGDLQSLFIRTRALLSEKVAQGVYAANDKRQFEAVDLGSSDKSKPQTPKQNDDLGWALAAMDLVRNHLIHDGCKETDDPTTCDTKLWNLRAAVVSIKNYRAAPSAMAPTKQIEDALSLSIHWLDCLRCHVHGEPRERFDAMLKGNREALAMIRLSDGSDDVGASGQGGSSN